MNHKILIIEDNEKNSLLLSKTLESEKYIVSIANNGKDGLELAISEKPDVILLDVRMPEMDGYQTIELLKKQISTKDIPVIFLTSQAEQKEIIKGFDLGAVDYITKPANKKELLLRLKTHIDLKMKTELLKEENKKLFQQKSSLMQFFSEDVAKSIIDNKLENIMEGQIIPVSILFMDIRNFTGISENLQPELVADLLNTLFTDIMDIVFTNQGSVNKLIGDAILATFGAPIQGETDSQNAVKCALDIQNMITLYNKAKPDYLQADINVGIGIATGKVFAGNIGSFRRIEYTVIGDTVNTASRLESMTKELKTPILIDENTAQSLSDKYGIKLESETLVKGKKKKVRIYSITLKDSKEDEVDYF